MKIFYNYMIIVGRKAETKVGQFQKILNQEQKAN